MQMPEGLDIAQIHSRIRTRFIGHPLLHLDSVDSTNVYLKGKTDHGQVSVGTVVIAENQTEGEGRFGRVWDSPRSLGLWFSVLLDGRPEDKTYGHLLTLAAGVAVILGVRQTTGLRLSLRWPNDVYWEERKIAGILCRSVKNQTRNILGIGINVNQLEPDFHPAVRKRAASLRQATGCFVNRETVFVDILEALERQVGRLNAGDIESVLMRYVQFNQLTDRHIRLELNNRLVEGKVAGFTREGRLILETGGKREHFGEGEVKEVNDAAGH